MSTGKASGRDVPKYLFAWVIFKGPTMSMCTYSNRCDGRNYPTGETGYLSLFILKQTVSLLHISPVDLYK